MIAHRFTVTVAEIIRENHLLHPDQIRPGTKIFVPQPESSVKLAK
jgi:LysM repeat protein